MDSFMRRLKYYGFGFILGLIFVVFFFQNRGCSWLPGNRVKNSFLDRVIVVSESESKSLNAQHISEEDVINMLNDGDVLFDKSVKKGNPQVYALTKEIDGKERTFFFTLPKESFISEVHVSEKSAKQVKNTTSGYGKIIHFPKDDNLVYVDSSKHVTCQQMEVGLISPKEIFKLIKKTGKIDFSKSHLDHTPKAEHHIEFIDKKGRTIGTKMIWYKNKLNITSFDLPFKTDCD